MSFWALATDDPRYTAAMRVIMDKGALHLSEFFSTEPEIQREERLLEELRQWVHANHKGADARFMQSWINHGFWVVDRARAELEKNAAEDAEERRMKGLPPRPATTSYQDDRPRSTEPPITYNPSSWTGRT